eukprot:m.78354 g.78354  ORF g.78354 m.78354 type:complete len:245 (-) comp16228_c0_seq1:339-1073(-)
MSTAAAAVVPTASGNNKSPNKSVIPNRNKARRATDKDKARPVGDIPRCAKEVMTILKAMGVTKHEPQVVPQLLEFCARYVGDVLDDAARYAEHRTQPGEDVSITKEDTKLAVEARMETSCSGPPPRELLLEIARKKNAEPLPLTPDDKFGVRLPSERFCLTNRNYAVLPRKRVAEEVSHGPWVMPHTQDAIEAAKFARAARQRRRLAEEAKQAALAPVETTTVDAQVADIGGATVDSDDDDYET